MLLRIDVEKTTNHLLVLGMMLLRFVLEELNTRSTQGYGHLDGVIPKRQLFWGR